MFQTRKAPEKLYIYINIIDLSQKVREDDHAPWVENIQTMQLLASTRQALFATLSKQTYRKLTDTHQEVIPALWVTSLCALAEGGLPTPHCLILEVLQSRQSTGYQLSSPLSGLQHKPIPETLKSPTFPSLKISLLYILQQAGFSVSQDLHVHW